MKINHLQIQRKQKSIRAWMLLFVIALVLSGLTALGVQTQMELLLNYFPDKKQVVGAMLWKAYEGVKDTNIKYPFMAYGFDWLAFSHIVIATVFLGPLVDPVRNKWVVQFGQIACCMVIPFALLMGAVRGLPLWWRLVDCSFGIIGMVPLSMCLKKIKQLEILLTLNNHNTATTLKNIKIKKYESI